MEGCLGHVGPLAVPSLPRVIPCQKVRSSQSVLCRQGTASQPCQNTSWAPSLCIAPLSSSTASIDLDPCVDRHSHRPPMPGGVVGIGAFSPSAAAGIVVWTAAARPINAFVLALLGTVAGPTRWSVGLPLSRPSRLSAATGDEWVTAAHAHTAAAATLARVIHHCAVACSRVPGDRRVCVLPPSNRMCRCGDRGGGSLYHDHNSPLALSQKWYRAPAAFPRAHGSPAAAAAAAAAATAAATTAAGPAPCKHARRAVRRNSC